MNSETRNCQNCKKDFRIEPADFDFYKKINVPPPTFCWRCRALRRMAFRNFRHLYPRTCSATGVKIFTLMPPEAPMPVYENRYWNSDNWNAMDYGQEYDFSRPFFEQFRDLYNKVPWGVMWSMETLNSEYGEIAYSKNCYLCFDSGYDEDSAYNVTLLYSKKCFDCLNTKDSELCYHSINTNQSYQTFFSRNCVSCMDVWFSQDCTGCTNCFGCSGLRNKKYYIWNEQHSKKSYEKTLAEMNLGSWSGIVRAREKAEGLWLKSPVKYFHGVQVTHSSGDYLFNGTELVNCFFVGTAQNMRYCQSVIYPPNKDSMDATSSEGTELAYETMACGGRGGAVNRTISTVEVENISDSAYAINCRNVSNVFGCVSLRSKNYCILNKQYSKDEYLKLLPKIKKHMDDMPYVDAQGRVYKYGEFFPFDMSSYGYAQTQAFDYFPLTEKEAQVQGFKWRSPDERKPATTIRASELPDDIKSVDDSILGAVIQCAHEEGGGHSLGCNIDCGRAFRIVKQELDFYRQTNLPLPRLCFNCRHIDRIKWRNAPALYPRQCMCDYKVYKNSAEHLHHPSGKCPNQFQTSYAPDRPEIVYCEACYNAEVA